MANNPKVQTIFYKLNDQQLETLKNGGTITKGDNTFTASPDRGYIIPSSSVSFKPQSLTSAQQLQARTNIGAGTSNFSGDFNDLTNKLSAGTGINIDGSNVISSKGTIPWIEVEGSAESYTYVDEDTHQSVTLNLIIFDLDNTEWSKLTENAYIQFLLDYTKDANENIYTDIDGIYIVNNYSSSMTINEFMQSALQITYNGNDGQPLTEASTYRQFLNMDTSDTQSDYTWCISGTIKVIDSAGTDIKFMYATSQNLTPLYNMIGDIETLLGGI